MYRTNLFNKVGGILICDYDKNIVKVSGTNLKCDIKSSDYDKLTSLAHDFAFSPYELEHLKKNISSNELVKSSIKIKNRYLDNDEFGFKITYLNS